MKTILLFLFAISMAYAQETRRKVVVIDSGVGWHQSNAPFMCKNGVLSFVGDSGLDDSGHGTNIIGIISKKMDIQKYCIVSMKFWVNPQTPTQTPYMEALSAASRMSDVAVLNMSLTGPQWIANEDGYINRMLLKGTKVHVAAGNTGTNLTTQCISWPACNRKFNPHDGFRVIGAKDFSGSNVGDVVTDWRPGFKQGFPAMTGTSQATANFTAEAASK